MAKQKSLIIQNDAMVVPLVLVKSRRYGDHFRAARGTYKKAKLNASCKKSGKELLRANVPAKLIQDALAPYREGFYDGSMWSRLLSVMKKAQGGSGTVDFGMLRHFETYEDYPLERFFHLKAEAKVNDAKSKLEVRFTFDTHATFEKRIRVDGYRLSLIGIFPDVKKKTAATAATDSDVIKLQGGKPAPIALEVSIPRGARIFVACLRVAGCWRGKPMGTRGTQGMAIVETGVI